MIEAIDAMGLACPLPVVMAKKALKAIEGDGAVEINVDNKIATQNLTKLADSMGCTIAVNEIASDNYKVLITKGEGFQETAAEEGIPAQGGETVVCITGDTMGSGDDELGKNLLKSFIYALAESDAVPKKVIFYNGGVRMTTEGSPSIDDLQKLVEKGAEVISCGACLNHFGLENKLKVGEVSNMYVILESLNSAAKIIKP